MAVDWATILTYQRLAWKIQAVDMAAMGNNLTLGATSGTDNGPFSHNLSATVTDAVGNVWTATSVRDPAAGISGTLAASDSEPIAAMLQDPIPDISQSDLGAP